MIKTMWLASMLWPEGGEPLCVGADPQKVAQAGLSNARNAYGFGPVDRGSAMCCEPIEADDIQMCKIEVIE